MKQTKSKINYKELKKRSNTCLLLSVCWILLGIFFPFFIILTAINIILYIKYESDLKTCPNCGKSNAEFSSKGGLSAAKGAQLILTKKCIHCGCDLPEEMF